MLDIGGMTESNAVMRNAVFDDVATFLKDEIYLNVIKL